MGLWLLAGICIAGILYKAWEERHPRRDNRLAERRNIVLERWKEAGCPEPRYEWMDEEERKLEREERVPLVPHKQSAAIWDADPEKWEANYRRAVARWRKSQR